MGEECSRVGGWEADRPGRCGEAREASRPARCRSAQDSAVFAKTGWRVENNLKGLELGVSLYPLFSIRVALELPYG